MKVKYFGNTDTLYIEFREADVSETRVNFCVYDSTWEASDALELDRNPNVAAWVKNDHLGFEIPYIFQGVVKKYRPDFLIRLSNGRYLVLETKGKEKDQDKTKREFLKEWVLAVNEHGGFGTWSAEVAYHPGDVMDILKQRDCDEGLMT